MVQIVRLQLIQERVKDAPWYDTAGDSNTHFKAPASFYLKALKSQIENFKQQIPNKVRNNRMFTILIFSPLINSKLTTSRYLFDAPLQYRTYDP